MGKRMLLADVGGTHIRFAIAYDGQIELVRKYYVSEFPNLEQATERYLSEVERSTHFFDVYALSSAAVQDGDLWRFTNHNKWIIDIDKVAKSLPVREFRMIDDFTSNAYGTLNVSEENLHVIRPASSSHDPDMVRCITGCGTGLGLSYIIPFRDQLRVHGTWGGHMVPACVTQEQWDAMQAVQGVKTLDSSPIFEDMVSGPGFSRLYHALKGDAVAKDMYCSAKELLSRVQDAGPVATRALRLFHEFLGLYVHQAVVYTHAYGAIYLTGGMIDAVFGEDLFDTETFLKYFHMHPVPVVAETLHSVPIYWIRDEYVALQGLVNAYQMDEL